MEKPQRYHIALQLRTAPPRRNPKNPQTGCLQEFFIRQVGGAQFLAGTDELGRLKICGDLDSFRTGLLASLQIGNVIHCQDYIN